MEKQITLTRVFDAPAEKVWRAWADKNEIQKWWGPRGVNIPTCEWDVRVGGALYIVMLAGETLGPLKGQKWPMKGVFIEVDEGKQLGFTNIALDAEGNTLLEGLTTAMFENEDGKTKLTLQTGAAGEGENVEQMLAGMEQGWSEQLDKLGELLQK